MPLDIYMQSDSYITILQQSGPSNEDILECNMHWNPKLTNVCIRSEELKYYTVLYELGMLWWNFVMNHIFWSYLFGAMLYIS